MQTYKGTVTIDVNEFITLHNNVDKLNAEHKELYNVNSQLQDEIIQLENQHQELKTKVLGMLFKRDRMDWDNRKDQTHIYSDGTPSYLFGFRLEHTELLLNMGYTMPELITYINAQWDIKDAKELEENEDTEEPREESGNNDAGDV